MVSALSPGKKEAADDIREAGRGQIMWDLEDHNKEFRIYSKRVGNHGQVKAGE